MRPADILRSASCTIRTDLRAGDLTSGHLGSVVRVEGARIETGETDTRFDARIKRTLSLVGGTLNRVAHNPSRRTPAAEWAPTTDLVIDGVRFTIDSSVYVEVTTDAGPVRA